MTEPSEETEATDHEYETAQCDCKQCRLDVEIMLDLMSNS